MERGGLTLSDLLKNSDKSKNGIIELMQEDNGILEDIKWLEGNETNGHTTTIRTGLPQPTWRRLYEGIEPSKSKVSKVTDTCGMLEARSEVDADLVDLNSHVQDFRLLESRAHIEGMNQEFTNTLFYGDTKVNPHHFMGLAPRYAFSDAPNVIDAGGVGSDNTSIWGVVWGDDAVHGIFPKGSMAGLVHQDIGTYDAFDDNNNRYRAKGDLFKWKAGLCVRDWRCVVRIANIDVSDMSMANLQQLTIKAKNLIPQSKRKRLVWYANEAALTGLELEAMSGNNTQFRYGEYLGSSNVLMIHGLPVRACDAIRTDEDALPTLA